MDEKNTDKKAIKPEIDQEIEKAFWQNKPVSATDCTGLVPGLPYEESSMEEYANMYGIAVQGGLKEVMRPDGSVKGTSNQLENNK